MGRVQPMGPMNYADLTGEELLRWADGYVREGNEQRAQTVLLFALVKLVMADE